MGIPDFCREIEAYLCRKNDGHLIRVTGPSFDLVAGWAHRGMPIKVAFKGIDRYFERYYRSGPRRRPVRIDFCEADVLDAFDEWRRATGIGAAAVQSPATGSPQDDAGDRGGHSESRQASLPAHLKRVLLRLTSARSTGLLGAAFDPLIDRVAAELDGARSVRGAARQALINRLDVLDREFVQQARAQPDETATQALAREADEELRPFRDGMNPEAFARAREAVIDRLVRERYNLPAVRFMAS